MLVQELVGSFGVAEWDLAPTPPRAARRAGITSLILWGVIVVAGRMIAYNWFDCDKQPQPKAVNVFAGCVVPPSLGSFQCSDGVWACRMIDSAFCTTSG